ncbi:MAG: hypothetical protein EXQ47_02450 [Bryobacterales bacterium]|nr:hypothetical protein [Bryobacterales bacterium]
MKVSYRGIQKQLPANLQTKLDARFATLSKRVDGRGEKQVLHQTEKWRATTRRSESMKTAAARAEGAAPPNGKTSRKTAAGKDSAAAPRIFQANQHQRRKPITLEEAVLQMEDGRDYLVYRDTDKESVHVLVRRRDGHFDLIES